MQPLAQTQPELVSRWPCSRTKPQNLQKLSMEDLNQRKHDLKMEENYHSNVMGTLATSLTEFSGRVQMKEGGAKSLAKEVEATFSFW